MVTINNLYETVTNGVSECFYKDEINISVSLIDFNGNRVSRDSVTITCDKGVFTSNNSKSITVNLPYGYYNLDYKATEWGLCTFKCNNSIHQLFVHGNGVKSITTTQGESPRWLYVDKTRRKCMFSYYFKPQTLSQKDTVIYVESNVIPSEFRPTYHIRVPSYRPDVVFTVTSDGRVGVKTTTANASIGDGQYVRFEWTY